MAYSKTINQNRTVIFVVEDDLVYSKMVKYTAELNPDNEVHVFSNGKDCLKNLHLTPDIITLDYSLPDMSGEDVLKRIKKLSPKTHVIILSGQQDIGTAIQLLKNGASDYIIKNKETKDLLFHSINLLKKNLHLEEEVQTLREELTEQYKFGNMLIGNSPPMQKVFKLLERAVNNDITVSITGETGTGKEVVAKSIHYNSSRKKNNFIAVNMSAIPKDLLESELFGYEKGAFTGANARKIGKFELANKGTLFLDEIGDMDIHMQAKLLRALQEREIMRVGGMQPIKFDAKIIVATHKDLMKEVQKGNFREDLYYRILGLPIELPPLRDRENDILILAKHFLEKFNLNRNNKRITSISLEAKHKLMNYDYPGNVRELRAVIELAAVLASGKQIKASDIQFKSPRKSVDILDGEMSLKEYNRKIIFHYLEKYRNVMTVAKKLDIGKSTIYKLLKEDKEISQLIRKF